MKREQSYWRNHHVCTCGTHLQCPSPNAVPKQILNVKCAFEFLLWEPQWREGKDERQRAKNDNNSMHVNKWHACPSSCPNRMEVQCQELSRERERERALGGELRIFMNFYRLGLGFEMCETLLNYGVWGSRCVKHSSILGGYKIGLPHLGFSREPGKCGRPI